MGQSEEEALAAFERDVPEALRDDLRVEMCEAAHYEDYRSERVHILHCDRHDAICVTVQGSVRLGEEEYSFILESGNIRGDVLLDWEGGAEFEYSRPTVYTLQPRPDLVDRALASMSGPFLVKKWNIFMGRREVSEIAGKYMYDRHFAPGCRTEQYWSAQAARHQMVLVPEDVAAETRERLMAASGLSTREHQDGR